MSDEDFRRVTLIAAGWDTLGWVHYLCGDLPKAEKYLTASWSLSQRGDVGDHLGQLYARMGKREEAIHIWRLAVASDASLEETRERLRKAGESANLKTRF